MADLQACDEKSSKLNNLGKFHTVITNAFPLPNSQDNEESAREQVPETNSELFHTVITNAFEPIESIQEDETKDSSDAPLTSSNNRTNPLTFPVLRVASLHEQLSKLEKTLKNISQDIGYTENVLKVAMIDCDFDIIAAMKLLEERTVSAYEKSFSGPSFCREYSMDNLVQLWKSPISVRVSSWLPKKFDEKLRTPHTAFMLVVASTSRRLNHWQLEIPYASLHAFYIQTYNEVSKKFPSGMDNAFPDDLWRGTLFGVSDEMRDWRQKGLDKWFRELLLNPKMFIDVTTRSQLYEFLRVADHISVRAGEADEWEDIVPLRPATLSGCEPFWK